MLEFYAIESPLAQPRNAILGQLICVITGVSVARLFLLSDKFDDIQWIGGALACAAATALMALTKTVHPPAGATALLAVVDQGMLDLGWLLVPVVLLSCALMLAVALVLNNVERQFPIYWWTPEGQESGRLVFLRRSATKATESNDDYSNENAIVDGGETTDVETNAPAAAAVTYLEAEQVIIKRGQVIVPEHMFITQEEELLLEEMCYRL